MKTRYNLSKIMKEAHRLMRVEGYTRSQALTLAWDKAKRSEFYLIIERPQVNRSFEYNVASHADSLINYYANNRYTMD